MSWFRRGSFSKTREKDDSHVKIKASFSASDNPLGIRLSPVEGGATLIGQLKEGSPAHRAHLRVGDQLIEMNGFAVKTMSQTEISDRIRKRPLQLVLHRTIEEHQLALGEYPQPQSSRDSSKNDLNFPPVGMQFDFLHKFCLKEEVRNHKGDSKTLQEPPTGWRWRPGTVQNVVANPNNGGKSKLVTVRFLDLKPGYPQEDYVDSGENDENVAPFKLKSGTHVMHHKYHTDDPLDILDYFKSRIDGLRKSKWRKAQVVAVKPYFIRIAFSGWSETWDTWIHVLEEEERIAELGMYTERAQLEESTRETNFRKAMLAKGLQVVDVSPDGNCLFRSMSQLLFGDQTHHKSIRAQCCDYLESQAKRFEFITEPGEFPNYVANMRQQAVWGDEPELRVLEELYDRPIEMYSCDIVGTNLLADPTLPMDHYRVGEEVAGLQDTEPLRLSFHGNNHYNAVVKVDAKPTEFNPTPEQNEGRIRKHRNMQGGGSMVTLRSHRSSSVRAANPTNELK